MIEAAKTKRIKKTEGVDIKTVWRPDETTKDPTCLLEDRSGLFIVSSKALHLIPAASSCTTGRRASSVSGERGPEDGWCDVLRNESLEYRKFVVVVVRGLDLGSIGDIEERGRGIVGQGIVVGWREGSKECGKMGWWCSERAGVELNRELSALSMSL